MATTFWPNADHWSCEIPLDTPHPRLDALAARGFVRLTDLPFEIPAAEYLDLEYMDWKSGGDTNFAPIATADGELDCRGFWSAGDERPDKGARFTSNASKCPTIKQYVIEYPNCDVLASQKIVEMYVQVHVQSQRNPPANYHRRLLKRSARTSCRGVGLGAFQRTSVVRTNVVSRKPYNGINILLLELHRLRYGFTSKWFGTFDQVKNLGSAGRSDRQMSSRGIGAAPLSSSSRSQR